MSGRRARPGPAVERIADLLGRTAQGDAAAFAALYDVLVPDIWLAALAVCHDATTARKATEQVFVELWRAAPLLAAQPDCPVSRLLRLTHRVLRLHAEPPDSE
ncbi:hypothetical protein [Streptacidiphilus jiangxiensis]|uniref:hypothetical protein n=1 Tax=Streptacidiphilus jiangxiensis TaxID=235985 RepID=UPI000694ACB6|nr:hypothetical protein [Streptacidiphilus jiangxiensis]